MLSLTTLQDKHHYLYFTDVKTEAQRGRCLAMSPGLLTGVRCQGSPGCCSLGLCVPSDGALGQV